RTGLFSPPLRFEGPGHFTEQAHHREARRLQRRLPRLDNRQIKQIINQSLEAPGTLSDAEHVARLLRRQGSGDAIEKVIRQTFNCSEWRSELMRDVRDKTGLHFVKFLEFFVGQLDFFIIAGQLLRSVLELLKQMNVVERDRGLIGKSGQ